MSEKRIFFTNGGGRLGNQLTNIAHLIAFQKEYEGTFRVLSLPFWKYAAFFDTSSELNLFLPNKKAGFFEKLSHTFLSLFSSKTRPLIENYVAVLIHLLHQCIPTYRSLIIGLPGNSYKFIPGKILTHGNFSDPSFMDQLKNATSTALAGWPIRSWELFSKHQEHIRAALKINSSYLSNATKFILEQRKDADFLIGIFIRQTDYKNWHNGRFYFRTEEYAQWMDQLQKLYPSKKIRFIIACDDHIDTSSFKMDFVFTTGAVPAGGPFIESIAELSLCDLIVSPPSTFSLWAAFMGNVPFLPVSAPEEKIVLASIIKNSIQDAINHPVLSLAIR